MTTRVPVCTRKPSRLSLYSIPRGWLFLGAWVASWGLVYLISHILAAITRLASGV